MANTRRTTAKVEETMSPTDKEAQATESTSKVDNKKKVQEQRGSKRVREAGEDDERQSSPEKKLIECKGPRSQGEVDPYEVEARNKYEEIEEKKKGSNCDTNDKISDDAAGMHTPFCGKNKAVVEIDEGLGERDEVAITH